MLLQLYNIDPDPINRLPLLFMLVGIYLFWKWIQSVRDSSSSRSVGKQPVIEADKDKYSDGKENATEFKDVEQSEQIVPKKKHSLSGAFSDVSTPAMGSSAKNISAIEQGQQAEDKESVKPKLTLKGAFANLSIPQQSANKQQPTGQDEDTI